MMGNALSGKLFCARTCLSKSDWVDFFLKVFCLAAKNFFSCISFKCLFVYPSTSIIQLGKFLCILAKHCIMFIRYIVPCSVEEKSQIPR